MKKIIRIGLIWLLSGFIFTYAANSIDQTSVIRSNLRNNLPDLVIDRILPLPVPGIYEIDSGRKVFYVDSTGKYAFVGNLLDLSSKTNLTEPRVRDLSYIDWRNLPIELAIRRIIGKGQHRIAIFTDPDCPFCKRLENETIPKLDNVTIYYYLFPLPIHTRAADDAKRILCAENPGQVFESYMAQGRPLPKNSQCNNAAKLAKMQEIGNNIVQVSGTPTIILPNGKIISGLIPADYLLQQIELNSESNNIFK